MSMGGSLVLNLTLDALFLVAALVAVYAVAVTWGAVGAKVLGLRSELELARRAPIFSYTVTRHDGFSAKPQMPLMLIASGNVRVKAAPMLRWTELRAAA